MSHEMLLSLGAETVLAVERNMAAPLCEVLPPCRGRRAHHVQKERVGNWEIPRLTTGRDADLVRIGKVTSRSL